MTTQTMDPAVDRQVAAHTILERSVCLSLSCHYLGNDRKVDLAALVTRRRRTVRRRTPGWRSTRSSSTPA